MIIDKNQKKHRWNPKKKKKFIATVVILILIAAAVGVYSLSNMTVTDVSEEEADLTFVSGKTGELAELYESKGNKGKVNILVLGINTNLTDAIMLVNYDKKTQDMNIISVPRDTYYVRNEDDSDSNKKINAAYKGKIINTAKAVSDIMCDIPINYYVVLDYDAVEKIVDEMGGVPMDIPFHMYRNDVWDEPPLHIDIPEGYQVLDGENAVKFLRFRHGDPGYPSYPMQDLDRVKAQQEFIKSAIKQCIGLDIVKISKVAYKEVKCNMKVGNVVSLATSAIGITSENVASYTLPGTVQESSPWYYYPDEDGIKELITNIYAPQEAEE
ncbi:MAG: LCP family protein [Eubacteriales bacterium]|nr:LCP family protein [Eubacteriales bacterium]MDD4389960.1 LCP family protein [Eubacteriales bacterium]